MNQADLMNYLQIRYVKLHFTLEMTDGGRLPRDKSSAIRGGMGHALLNTNCIRDEKCPGCDFADDCLVRRMMYPEMKIRPDFMQTQDSEGFIVESFLSTCRLSIIWEWPVWERIICASEFCS